MMFMAFFFFEAFGVANHSMLLHVYCRQDSTEVNEYSLASSYNAITVRQLYSDEPLLSRGSLTSVPPASLATGPISPSSWQSSSSGVLVVAGGIL